jgi:hypothetical protein
MINHSRCLHIFSHQLKIAAQSMLSCCYSLISLHDLIFNNILQFYMKQMNLFSIYQRNNTLNCLLLYNATFEYLINLINNFAIDSTGITF